MIHKPLLGSSEIPQNWVGSVQPFQLFLNAWRQMYVNTSVTAKYTKHYQGNIYSLFIDLYLNMVAIASHTTLFLENPWVSWPASFSKMVTFSAKICFVMESYTSPIKYI